MFLDIINDIKKAIDAEAYLSALALSLALPDICGKVEFPQIKSNKKRYVDWYDKHITYNNYPDDYDDSLKFDGEKCYKLRCAFLHAGEVDQLIGIENFELIISPKTHPMVYGGGCYTTNVDKDGNTTYTITQDVAQLCFWIYRCANGYYERHPNKSDFDKISPIIKLK